MVVMKQARGLKSQFGATVNDAAAYSSPSGGGISFAVGQTIFVRFYTRIPKGSVINSASLRFNLAVKTASTTQSSYHIVQGDGQSDSPLLRPGNFEALRPKTTATVNWTCSWTANPPDTSAVYSSINVKPIVDELLARPGYTPGAYMTFMVRCTDEAGSDMSVQINNPYAGSPTLIVDFTPPVTDEFVSFNICENSEFNPTLNGLGDDDPATTGNIPNWGQNAFYGSFVDPASTSRCTMTVDTSFTRLPGIPSLKITTGVPPSTPAFTGPMCSVITSPGDYMIFSGWIYLSPATSGCDVWVGDVYNSFYSISGLPRSAWRPFCSAPLLTTGTDDVFRWPAVGLRGFAQGVQYWISEPTIMLSNIRQMPFNGLTPDKSNGVIDHQSSVSRQASKRIWTPRTVMMVDGVPKRVPTWTRRSDVATAIVELCEPVKGGPEIQNLPAGQTVGGIPAGVTVTEL